MINSLERTRLASLCFASLLSASAQAASFSHLLDQSNMLADGTPYATVTLDDDTANTLTFTITPLGAFTPDSNFGVQEFGFNVSGSIAPATTWTLPTGWTSEGSKSLSEFGVFDIVIAGNGHSRQSPLVFSLTNSGLALASFFTEASTKGYYFAAHIAGFKPLQGTASTFVADSAAIPLPAPAWLLGTALGALGLIRRRLD